jgi:hypothetical protein
MSLSIPTDQFIPHVWPTICLTEESGPSYHLSLLMYALHRVQEDSIFDVDSPELQKLLESLFYLPEDLIGPVIRPHLTSLLINLKFSLSSDISRIRSILSLDSKEFSISGNELLGELLTFFKGRKHILDSVYGKVSS